MRAKKESPTRDEIMEIEKLCYAGVRGLQVDQNRAMVLFRRYPKTYSAISDRVRDSAFEETRKAYSLEEHSKRS